VSSVYIAHNNDKKLQTRSGKFHCSLCDYNTSKQSQYNRHLMTRKHKTMTNNDGLGPRDEKPYKCNCGNQYRFRQGLFTHKKTCKNVIRQDPINDTCHSVLNTVDIQMPNSSIILELIRQNQDFTPFLI
jgi:hypothetical protein